MCFFPADFEAEGLEDAVFRMFGDNWAVTSDLNKLPSELYSRVSER